MKKYFTIILLCAALLLTGCSMPVDSQQGDDITQPDHSVKSSEDSINGQDISHDPVNKEEPEKGVSQDDKERIAVTVYYQDKDRNIIPATRWIAKQEGVARAAIRGLIDSPLIREELEYYGLYPVLPAGTEILGISIKEGSAAIDFNSNILNYVNKDDEKNIITSVVYTLTEFKTIDKVKILVNGYPKEDLKYNTYIGGPLGRDNVLINSDSVNISSGNGKLDSYMFKTIDDKYAYMLPVSAEVPNLSEAEVPNKIIELLASPANGGRLYTELPEGTDLIDSTISNKILTLNFNDKLVNYGGTARESGMLAQILHSMKQVEGVEGVKILVGGEVCDMPEGTDTSKPFALPQLINDFIDN